MKMRTIIEAGRKTSPLVNQWLEVIQKRITQCSLINEDRAIVKSDASRDSLDAELANELDALRGDIGDLIGAWKTLDSLLGDYKYKFKKPKKDTIKDLPGQQTFFDSVT